jgi:RNA-directed DNA polymerase
MKESYGEGVATHTDPESCGVPMNYPALSLFLFQVGWLWHRALSRRSQNGRVRWDRMRRLIGRYLPRARVCHPYPLRRLGVIT